MVSDLTEIQTKISWVMTHHLNKNLHSEKSDQAPLKVYSTNIEFWMFDTMWCGAESLFGLFYTFSPTNLSLQPFFC